jgi:hypothetical protein
MAPAVTVCNHVLHNTASKWVRFPMLYGQDNVGDCLCERCFLRGAGNIKVGKIAIVCMFCFRDLEASTKASIRTACPEECVRLGYWTRDEEKPQPE